MLLAFESVARNASACVCDAQGTVLEACDSGAAEAEEVLVGMLDGLIRRHGLPSRLAVACGPGSFSGLRISVTAARTLAWLDGLPVHAVDALTARALQEGDGLWWVLMPLKRDTTFHALIAVDKGMPRSVTPVVAALDAAPTRLLPEHAQAIAIGPALASKPDLARHWNPPCRLGSPAALRASGVAAAASSVAAVDWSRVVPAYHQEPAPVLQRRERELELERERSRAGLAPPMERR